MFRNAVDPMSSPRQVHSVTLDTLVKDEPRVDIVRMDIEGSEGLALQGMQSLLRTHRPILLTELSPRALTITSGIAPEDFLNRLRGLN